MMSNQKIAYIVQAVADGCAWKQKSSITAIYTNKDMGLILRELALNIQIELIPSSWDWPQERRTIRKCWFRLPYLEGGSWTKWELSIFYDPPESRSFEYVAINPAAPDQPPPSDWSPETYPRVLEDEKNE